MYGIYNAETLEKLIKTVCSLHDQQFMYKSLFAGKVSAAYEAYSQMHGTCSIQHYTVNSMLCLCTIKEKYIEIYNEFISQLCIYAKAIRILAKGYLSVSLITPLSLKRNLDYSKTKPHQN